MFYTLQEKIGLEEGINIAKLAVFNAVGSQSVNYFRNLDRILNQLPCTIMGMSWHQVLVIKCSINGCINKKMLPKIKLDPPLYLHFDFR